MQWHTEMLLIHSIRIRNIKSISTHGSSLGYGQYDHELFLQGDKLPTRSYSSELTTILRYLPTVPLFVTNIDTYGNDSYTSNTNKKYYIGINISSQGYRQ